MDRDKPHVAGYVRCWPGGGGLKQQKRLVEDWFWHRGREDYRWMGWGRDRSKRTSRKHHLSRVYMLKRGGLRWILGRLKPGDALAVPWLGILCHTAEDAIHGLPWIFSRGVKVYVVLDRLWLKEEHVDVIRMLRREWYADGTVKTPDAIGCLTSKVSPKREAPWFTVRRKQPELRFMQACYRWRFMEAIDWYHMVQWCRCEWPEHPRLGIPVTKKHVEEASNAYKQVLDNIALGRKVPAWVRESQTQGYFTETLEMVAHSRAAHLYRLAESVQE